MQSKTSPWLIRHAEYQPNDSLNNATASLTEKGKLQARTLSEKIINPPDLIIVSPYTRAQETAKPVIEKWPNAITTTWPIHEITYLDPIKFREATPSEREQKIKMYWTNSDPNFRDGDHAETFNEFIKRVKTFNDNLKKEFGYIVVIGHGQFFKAYAFAKQHGFSPTKEWMQMFRKEETAHPLAFCEILIV